MSPAERFRSLNPATGVVEREFDFLEPAAVEECLERAATGASSWAGSRFEERRQLLTAVAERLETRREELAQTMTAEMGKPIGQARAEVDKCARGCRFFAREGERLLEPETVATEAAHSAVHCRPLGVVLAIMPWNFPLWQAIRCAAPAIMAGNAVLLKHSPNTPQMALALEALFREAGAAEGQFQSLFVPVSHVAAIISDRRVAAVTLTGSVRAGRAVAAAAGEALKKVVLELGGSDPFIVLADADLQRAVETAVFARFQNSGQSCIASKRFLVVADVYEEFEERFVERVRALKVADPAGADADVGPLARDDLRAALAAQVEGSVAAGARLLTGGRALEGAGFFYEPTLLAGVDRSMPAGCEETFGPAAALLRVSGETEAVRQANETEYGLGASIWSRDLERAAGLAAQVASGQVFVNALVASDPRLPFGGVKDSGFGRELGREGIREFVNLQTVWMEE